MPYKTSDDRRAFQKRHYHANREELRAYYRNYNQQIKAEVLTYYGNGKLACVHCGFDDVRALSLDHINGDGAERRRKGEPMGVMLYRKLRRGEYPQGYQTLCGNCQLIKKFENREWSDGGWKNRVHKY